MADSNDQPPSYDKAAAEHGDSAASARPPPPRKLGPLPLDLPIIKYLNTKRVVLASASPRRKALLQQVSRLYSFPALNC